MEGCQPIPIAVVGMSCRFPAGANDPEKFWTLLSEGKSSWTKVPNNRFKEEAYFHLSPDQGGAHNHRGGHFIDQDPASFDASFFGITPAEANAMDPQHRLQLETAYEALENAGITLSRVRGSKTSVFIGIFSRDYDRMMNADVHDIAKYHMTGTGDAILSNRISYLMDLQGASMTLDTGCSGGLVALHQACQNLRANESNMALVGGSNLILSPNAMVSMSFLHILNSEGKCFPFDSRGSGYGRGEGVATIVLKRFQDAVRCGDPIRAVIRNTGVNQDGRTSGITLPSQKAQETLSSELYHQLKLNAHDIQYIEAHGTGTVAGDTAEIKSISNIFSTDRRPDRPLFVGSVKSNVGHLESASGLAGLIKVVLMLEKRLIPPSVNFDELKSGLSDHMVNIKIPSKLEIFPKANDGSRRASVNSFGYGGTNAHAILESAMIPTCTNALNGFQSSRLATLESHPRNDKELPSGVADILDCSANEGSFGKRTNDPDIKEASQISTIIREITQLKIPTERANLPKLLVMSAKSEHSLVKWREDLAEWAHKEIESSLDLENLAYTLSETREHMPWRTAVVVNNINHLVPALTRSPSHAVKVSDSPRLNYIFTGQGSQWCGMGRELIAHQADFRKSIARSEDILRALGASWSLSKELLAEKKGSRINESQIAQPATSAIQIALIDLLSSIGLRPTGVVGHSSGEIAAAYAAGALSHDTALAVSYQRGLVSHEAKRLSAQQGGMLAVGLGEAELAQYIAHLEHGLVCVACVNSLESTTVSGDMSAIRELQTILDNKGLFARVLKVDTAYHSHHVERVAAKYQQALHGLDFGKCRSDVTMISSVTGTAKQENFGPSYWVENLTSKVRFSEALVELCSVQRAAQNFPVGTTQTLVEIGPHSVLSSPTHKSLETVIIEPSTYSYLPSLVRGQDSFCRLLTLVGKLFERGHSGCLSLNTFSTRSPRNKKIVQSLPPYHWDHNTRYWHESRSSKDQRLREHPYHDLLGVPLPGATPFDRIWRHFLDVESLPWLNDHVVDECIIFPGAAYICMAIESIRQDTQDCQPEARIRSFILHDVVFSKALLVPEPPHKIEVQLCLRRRNDTGSRSSSGWKDFRVSSCSKGGTWNEHCQGSIMVEFAGPGDGLELSADDCTSSTQKSLANHLQYCIDHNEMKDSDELYEELRSNGNFYGTTFANLKKVHLGQTRAVGTVQIPDTAGCMPSNFQQPHIIHPSTLDSIFHLDIALFLQHCSKGSVMPLSMREVNIPAEIVSSPGKELVVSAKIFPQGSRSATTDVIAFHVGENCRMGAPISVVHGELCAVGDANVVESAIKGSREITSSLQWGPDAEFLNEGDLNPPEKACMASQLGITSNLQAETLDQVAALYIRDCLGSLSETTRYNLNGRMSRLLKHMERYAQTTSYKRYLSNVKEEDLAQTVASISGMDKEIGIVNTAGNDLISLFSGKARVSDILSSDQLLHCECLNESPDSSQLTDYLKHLTYKQPHMKIIEVNAGTGARTLPVLQALRRGEQTLFVQYDLTDISATNIEHAKSLLQEKSRDMTFRLFNIDEDAFSQGIQEGSYDLVIAANGLHSTKDTKRAIQNAWKLLRPRGRLALVEVAYHNTALDVVLGAFHDCCKDPESRPLEDANLSLKEWDQIISETSFQKFNLVTEAHNDSTSRVITFIAQAVYNEVELPRSSVAILTNNQDDDSDIFHKDLNSEIVRKGFDSRVVPWSLAEVDSTTIYIVLDDQNMPLLANPSSEVFEQIRRLLKMSQQILWITGSQGHASLPDSRHGLVTGFSRGARAEIDELRLVVLDLQYDKMLASKEAEAEAIRATLNVFMSSFAARGKPGPIETEFALRDNKLLIPRLLPAPDVNKAITRSQDPAEPDLVNLSTCERPLRLQVTKPGLLDSLVFVNDTRASSQMQNDEIEIRVEAFGINFKDVYIALGQMKPDTPMCGECAGTVTAVGRACQYRFRPGDRVCSWLGTPYANISRAKGSNTARIPDSMPLTTAASIPIIFLTAYYSLIEVARLQKDQIVLIHSAAGGVGQAAIMIAQFVGAKVLATVGSATKRQLLEKKYGLLESQIFSSQPRGFKTRTLQYTKGKGVDVVLNSVSGEALLESWDCIARFGTFVEIGRSDIDRNTHIGMRNFEKNASFHAVDLVQLAEYRPQKMQSLIIKLVSMFEKNELSPVEPVTVMPISSIEDAFRLIQGRKHTGKVVLQSDAQALVKALPAAGQPMKLKSDGCYVIAGGLGRLGKRLLRFLADHGAKHLLVLSRRSVAAQERQAIEQAFNQGSTRISIEKCDIKDLHNVRRVYDQVKDKIPAVRGVLQAAMLLQDRIIEQMTRDELVSAIQPKVDGTINLQRVFQTPSLDFFIMLSSIASLLGPRSQANYAAGNAFQDSFAHMNSESTTKYASINLGFIEDSDVMNPRPDLRRNIVRAGGIPIRMSEVLSTLEYIIKTDNQQSPKQIAVGLDWQSLSESYRPALLETALFSHLEYATDQTKSAGYSQPSMTINKAISAATNKEQVYDIIIQSLAQQISSLLVIDVNSIGPDSSIDGLGLDSLIAIELKTWIARNLYATIQTSEILDTRTLRALAELAAEKCTLIDQGQEAQSSSVEMEEDRATVQSAHNIGSDPNLRSVKLPKPPLPDLQSTLEFYLYSIRAFCTDQEIENVSQATKSFLKPGSVGQKLMQRLLDRAAHSKIDSWLADLYNDHVYLKHREPVNPWQHFFGCHTDSHLVHTQAERAAIVSKAAFSFNKRVEQGQVETEYLNEQPLCMNSLKWIFNSTRMPGQDVDSMHTFPGNDYLVAMRKGHFFKVLLQCHGKPVSLLSLEATFRAILSQTGRDMPPFGIFTADVRSDWAKTRERIKNGDPSSRALIEMIEASAFIVCLDDCSPRDATERVNHLLVGEISNRWSDKSLQLVVCENGVSACICEHALIDGTTIRTLSDHLKQAIQSYSAEEQQRTKESTMIVDKLEECSFASSPEMDVRMEIIQRRFHDTAVQTEVEYFTCQELGETTLRRHSCPPKTGYQLIIQLASLDYFGYQPPSWETVSMRTFLKGRVDIIQAVLPPVALFCAAMRQPTSSIAERRALFHEAAKAYTNTATRVARGRGFAHHLYALQEVREADEEVPLLFRDPTYAKTRPTKLMTDCVEMPDSISEAMYAMPDPEHVFVHYEVDSDRCRFCIKTPPGRSEEFIDCLSRAARDMKDLLLAK